MALQAAAAHTSRIDPQDLEVPISYRDQSDGHRHRPASSGGLNRGSSQARSRRTVCITAAASALETPKPIAMIDYA